MHGIHSSRDASASGRRRQLCPTGTAAVHGCCLPRAADSIASDAAGDANDVTGGEWAASDSKGVSGRESERGEDQ